MKTLKFLFVFALVLVVFPASVFAHGDCLSGKEYAAYKKANKKHVILDVRSAKDYAKMHVMKAVNIHHMSLYLEPQLDGMLKPAAELASIFGKKGIGKDTKVVIYDDGSSKYSTRVYWILKYLGATEVKILHKNMTQWKMARIPLTRSASPVKKVVFTPEVNKAIFATTDDVKAALKNPNAVVIDTRPVEEFTGTSEKSKGHFPGAINIVYTDVLKSKMGFFKAKAGVEALMQKHGVTKDKEVILYCNTGIFAAITYFTLKNHLGYKNVKVYDGSYKEWVAKNNPLKK